METSHFSTNDRLSIMVDTVKWAHLALSCHLGIRRRTCNMEHFTNAEIAYMHLDNGAADGNAKNAVRLYQQRFPNRRLPNHQMFTSLHRQLHETGTFSVNVHDSGHPRHVRTPEMEEEILQRFANSPGMSTRAVACTLCK